MYHSLLYPAKQIGKVFRHRNLRPLILRIVWGVNVLLFSMVFWAFVYCLGNGERF